MDKNVVFKGSKDGISVIINRDASIHVIKDELVERSRESKKFFGKTKTALNFYGKELSDQEVLELTDIIVRESELEVTFISDEIYIEKYLKDKKEKESVFKNPDLPPIVKKEVIGQRFSEKENNTIFHKGSLRSGNSIKHSGSVVIIGDINPGGEVIAEGNVIVLGSAKGLIHAGCTGNKYCFVFALNLMPTQLRIGELITYIPKEMSKNKKKKIIPTYAYVDEDRIYISEME